MAREPDLTPEETRWVRETLLRLRAELKSQSAVHRATGIAQQLVGEYTNPKSSKRPGIQTLKQLKKYLATSGAYGDFLRAANRTEHHTDADDEAVLAFLQEYPALIQSDDPTAPARTLDTARLLREKGRDTSPDAIFNALVGRLTEVDEEKQAALDADVRARHRAMAEGTAPPPVATNPKAALQRRPGLVLGTEPVDIDDLGPEPDGLPSKVHVRPGAKKGTRGKKG